MTACGQELCLNWTGEGCICVVAGVDAPVCDGCGRWHDMYGACAPEPDDDEIRGVVPTVTIDTRGRT